MGATPVTCAEDVLGISINASASTPKGKSGEVSHSFLYEPRSETERVILEQLAHDPVHADEITRATLLPIDTLGSALTLLEMKGVIRHEGSRYYTRVK